MFFTTQTNMFPSMAMVDHVHLFPHEKQKKNNLQSLRILCND